MYLKRTFHTICTAVCFTAKRILPTEQRNILMLNPLIRVCEQESHVQILLIFTHIVSEYEVAGCSCTFVAGCVAVIVRFHFHGGEYYVRFRPDSLLTTFSRFTAAVLQPSLARCSFVGSQASVAWLCSRCFWRISLVRFWCFLVHSIHTVRFCFKQIARKFTREKVKSLWQSEHAHAHNVWSVLDIH